MQRAEFDQIFTSLSAMLGVDPASIPSRPGPDRLFDDLSEAEKQGKFRESDILRRVKHTVQLIRTRYPSLNPDLNAGGYAWHKGLTLDQKIQRTLGCIKEIFLDLFLIGTSQLDGLERFLRRINFGGNITVAEEHITIGGFMISQRCLGECNRSCGVGAKPTDPQMSWELFDAATSSDQILIDPNRPIRLSDGEVLIWQGRKKLFDVVERLVLVNGCGVVFTIAGLIPQNRELGIEFLDALPRLGPYVSDVRITLSLNFLFGFIRTPQDVEQYIRGLEETIEKIARANCNFGMIVLTTNTDYEQVTRVYHHLSTRFKTMERFDHDAEIREPTKIGMAETSGLCAHEGGKCDYGGKIGRYTLTPEGSLTNACAGFGKRGSRVGSVLDNDVKQIKELLAQHDTRFGAEVLSKDGEHCRLHQHWKHGRFTAPRSERPMLRLKSG